MKGFYLGESEILSEISFSEFLLRQAVKKEQLVERYVKRKGLTEEQALQRVDLVSEANPSGHYDIYTPWLVKLDIEGTANFPEDIDKIKEALTFFDQIKKKPIPIPKDIFQYKTFSDLAKAIEPYKQKGVPLSKREKQKLELEKGTKVVYDDGKYQVIEVSTEEAAHKLFRKEHWGIPTLEWCVKDPKYARQYLPKGPFYLVLKDGLPYALGHPGTGELRDVYDYTISMKMWTSEIGPILNKKLGQFYEGFPALLDPEEVDELFEKGENLDQLYKTQKLTQEQISKAIDRGEYLELLYENQNLSPENVEKALRKGEHLDVLYEYQVLSPEQIDKAIDLGQHLGILYEKQKLSPKNIFHAIEVGKELETLYSRQQLTPDLIDKALEKGIALPELVEHQKFSNENIFKAIEKGVNLRFLARYQSVPQDLVDRAIDEGRRDVLIILFHSRTDR